METHLPLGCSETQDTKSSNYFFWGFGRNGLFFSEAFFLSCIAPSPAITRLWSAASFWSALGCSVLPISGLSLMMELILAWPVQLAGG